MASETTAIEALTALGLTEYEARCFVALTRLSQGTAKDISRIADVPQSRVYDVTDELHRRGLIDVEESDPRRYLSLAPRDAIERLDTEYSDRLETANDALGDLESRASDDDGTWSVAAREDVLGRVRGHIEDATEEVYLHVAHTDLLERELRDALAECGDRGVSVYIEVPSETVQVGLCERLPTANVAVTDLSLDEQGVDRSTPGRLLMVDRETVLLSGRTDGVVPGERDETGVWASGAGHGIVAWLRPILTARITGREFATADE